MPARNPTKFVNFNRYFNANKAEAQEQADAFSLQAKAKADAAKAAQQKAVADFKQKSGQTQPQQQPMRTNVGQQPVVAAGSPVQLQTAQPLQPVPPPGPAYVPGKETWNQEPATPPPGPTPEALEQQAKDALYAGPEGLDSKDARAQAASADENLGLLASDSGLQTLLQQQRAGLTGGEGQLGAALTGAAGGKDFSRLRGYFQPGKELDAAEAAATADATRLKDEGAARSGRLKELAGAERKRLADVETDKANQVKLDAAAGDARVRQARELGDEMLRREGFTPQAGPAFADKPSWDEYRKTDIGQEAYKLKRQVSPDSIILDALDQGEGLDDYGPAVLQAKTGTSLGHDKDNNYSTHVDFWLASPDLARDDVTQARLFSSLTTKELRELEHMGLQSQRRFILERLQKLGLVNANGTPKR